MFKCESLLFKGHCKYVRAKIELWESAAGPFGCPNGFYKAAPYKCLFFILYHIFLIFSSAPLGRENIFFIIITYFFIKIKFSENEARYAPRSPERTSVRGPDRGQVFSGSEHMGRICARVSKKIAYGVFGAKFGPAACVSGPAKKPGRKKRGAQF